MSHFTTYSGYLQRNAVVLRLSIILFVVAMLLSIAIIKTPTAHAAPLAQAPSGCAVTYFHLNGSQSPTVTCLQKKSTGNAQPHISQVSCNSSGWFTLYTGNHVTTWCFGGGGSMPVGLSNVTGFSAGNNWGGLEYGGDYLKCFQVNKTSTYNYGTVNYLWLYENPYNYC